jgi:hypothetical protein
VTDPAAPSGRETHLDGMTGGSPIRRRRQLGDAAGASTIPPG